ncbi:exonuclease domain-containing protein [Marinobacterium arenosum]|uniref:exonuclease domain-containing protein n=1 Tax=Marinobacterium arenosum TaxID=2862496 RepID=UPI001C968565|nr:exonuclease domain-containing protein [Marinobacterium arenosum]MBY4675880.1 GIY-YIG nuclease family protein [Marinobacterium arenosum]
MTVESLSDNLLPPPAADDLWLAQLIFVDLETTGASLSHDRITEIGLIWYDREQGWQQWQSLVNPGLRIPPAIQQLTGISDAMVADAPPFAELAEQVQTLLNGRVIVAHNVRFDYGFLSRELARCQRVLGQRHLCTVRLSRALQPEEHKHNLATLIRRWDLQLGQHHRAMDDAAALAQLWGRWQQRFGAQLIDQQVKQAIREVHLPPQLARSDLLHLPDGPGVYLIYGDNDSLLYVGKSVDVRSRVFSHFSGALSNSRELKLVQQTRHIECRPCAGELAALLLESELIKQLQPIYNRRLRSKQELFCWRLQADGDGYLVPTLCSFEQIPADQLQQCYGQFSKASDAKKALQGLVKKHQLCEIRSGLTGGSGPCFGRQLKRCKGACVGAEPADSYNLRLQLALSGMAVARWPFDGPISIHEQNDDNGLHCWHLVHQWRYLGNTEEFDQIEPLLAAADDDNGVRFELDNYRILQRELRKLTPAQLQVWPEPRR